MQVKSRPDLDCPEQSRSRGGDRFSHIGVAVASTIQTECLAGTEDRHLVLPVDGHPAFAVYPPAV